MPEYHRHVVPSNAPVQLRAVDPTGAEGVAVSIPVRDLNRNDFLRSRARQLQRVLGGLLMETRNASAVPS